MTEPVVQRAAPTAADGGTFTYRPHLDGLRAVAVYLVVLFHAGLSWFEGGFIGVDVFFVLSGYLVTHVLLGDLEPTGGVGYARFYARRFRRLLPAAAVTLVVTGVVWARLVSPAELGSVVDGFRAAFFYVSNWWFISETSGYFAADIEANPILHFWSLSIEEQFYFVWPLLLAGLFAVGRRFSSNPKAVVRVAVVVLAAASLSWAWHLSQDNVSRAYYGTDARAYQLLAGAALALSPGLVRRAAERGGRVAGAVAVGGVAALLLVATSAADLSVLARGVAATALTVGVLVALEVSPGDPVKRVLSSRPMVELGRISYGTYLWHWPVIVIARLETSMGPRKLAVASAVLGTLLAALSSLLLERRVRFSPRLDRRPRLVIVAGLTISLAAGLAIVPLLERDSDTTIVIDDVETSAGTTGPLELDWEAAVDDAAPHIPCPKDDVEECHLHEGSGPRILMMGDSQTWSFSEPLTELAAEEDWDLWHAANGGCNWERGLQRRGPIGSQAEQLAQGCLDMVERWYTEVVPAVDPDVVVLIRSEGESPILQNPMLASDGTWYEWNTDEYHRAVEDAVDRTIAELRAEGRHVVIVEPWPITPWVGENPTSCLSKVETADDIDDCAYDALAGGAPSWLEEKYRAVAGDDPGVWTLDLDPLICPDGPRCPAVIDGVIVRRDWSHLTETFIRTNIEVIRDFLYDEGVVERP